LRILTLILAGGTGEELSVLTRHRAKTALPFGGRYRIIDFCLSNCVHSGINEIAVLAQYSPRSLIDHIRMGKPWDLDRRSGGVFILQPAFFGEAARWYLGTADALFQNIDIIRNSKADRVLVLSGDQVYLMDYGRMAEYHVGHGRPVTVAIKKVRASQGPRFGMVRCNGDGLITAFKEKPASSTYRYASLGIYLFDKAFLLSMLGSGKTDIVFDLVIPALEDGNVSGFAFDGYWDDLGSIHSYYRTSLRLIRHRSLVARSDWPILSRGPDLPPAVFSAESSVTESIVADGCRVEGKVSGSILFPGVRIGRGAVVENSIIFSSVRIGTQSRISGSIIDKEVEAGNESQIGTLPGDPGKGAGVKPGPAPGRAGGSITLVGKAVRISRGAHIAAGEIIEPNTTIRRT